MLKNINEVNKQVEPIYIKVSPTLPVLPQTLEDDLTKEQELALLTRCPKIYLSAETNLQQIIEFLIDLFSYYFELPKNMLTPESDLIDDIERQVWARELGVPYDDVTYGRIFCSKDDKGNIVGGIEDRGLMIATMFMLDFADLIGIKEVNNVSDATFEAANDEFGNYYDCNTISDLANLLYTVCMKLKDLA
ncbi:hypothetical protein BCU68_12450 [Vibrio sp. 10N.286.49.B3]|uniref:hypothetical protein n=1 Tax=Vibrio sp. 10N.286.49.B3 TaxID=1880855 RepID=UPI000C81FFED|nr:hypothetical protein [Vibrio sp. 10N.286.49.B3]PMH44652.1 hypothetical protein BCU68_12450 [Vibrio sp. 10N.286.49.B3]